DVAQSPLALAVVLRVAEGQLHRNRLLGSMIDCGRSGRIVQSFPKHLSMGIGLGTQFRHLAKFVPDSADTAEAEKNAIEGMRNVCNLAARAFEIAEQGLKEVMSVDKKPSGH
ncbi:hypothetical protein, partial [Xanthomonas citri]|uniref:hypothetical protein n=4 Tax=Xanthomonas citri TaxID=346 RepID=UPI0019D6F98C